MFRMEILQFLDSHVDLKFMPGPRLEEDQLGNKNVISK